jgi:hypothetical protein
VQCSRKSFKECQLPLIEVGLSTGGQSARNRLSDAVSEIRRSEGVASRESVSVLLEVIECLKKIEGLLSDNGFETWLGESISQKIDKYLLF